MSIETINSLVGNADLYLLDQILKGRFANCKKVLDLGCGEGRNLHFFLRNNYDVWGIDTNEMALKMARMTGRVLGLKGDQFVVGEVQALPFENQQFDLLMSSAVFHFAASQTQFRKMISEAHRVLKVNGFLFIRMASTAGLPTHRYLISEDGVSQEDQGFSYLLTADDIEWIEKTGFVKVEPFKTVLVEDQRSMGFLMLQKQA